MAYEPPPTDDWFKPRILYAQGYPPGLTSALQVLPALRRRLHEIVAQIAPECVLEVGPGNLPVVDPGPGVCYLDVSHALLAGLEGQRVEGDITRAPFDDDMFDLVVAADVFSHIEPGRRPAALYEMLRVAPRALIFNPEPGNENLRAAPVRSDDLAAMLRTRAATVKGWPVQIPAGGAGILSFGLLLATRYGA